MSESMPEGPPQRSSSGNVFMRQIGPMPLWGWMGIGLAIALGYYFWKQNSSKSASTNTTTGSTTGTDVSGQIPQFVNQTYVSGTPPTADMPANNGNPKIQPQVTRVNPPPTSTASTPGGVTTTVPHYLDRSWTTPNATMTINDIGKSLSVTDPGLNLHPTNTTAKNFMNNVFAKNPNAKVPKGAQFTYVYGS